MFIIQILLTILIALIGYVCYLIGYKNGLEHKDK